MDRSGPVSSSSLASVSLMTVLSKSASQRSTAAVLMFLAIQLSAWNLCWASSVTVEIISDSTPLLSSNKRDARVVRHAEQGEVFTAHVSSQYSGFYMVVDKVSNSFPFVPFSAAREIVPVPEDILISGQFQSPVPIDFSEWQVMPDDAPYTDGVALTKLRSEADGMLLAHNGKRYPAKYSFNENYRPRIKGAQLVRDALAYLDVPYVLGGTSLNGIDCSGLTRVCLAKQGLDLVHRASLQALEGRFIEVDQIKPGDLLFFKDDKTERYLSHVGIYIGNGKFVHASGSSGKVVITSLSSKYFKQQYAFARRL